MPDAPRVGQVLAERYEVIRADGGGPLSVDLLAFDQEVECQVWLRLLRTDGFASPEEGRRAYTTLRALVGAGGRFLAPLLDADRDGAYLFVVEPAPQGVSWERVLQRRAVTAPDGRFEAEELLPLAARLQAALDAMPPGAFHGVIRPSEVFIEEEGLRLHGAWFGSALSPRALRALVEMSEEHDLLVAPEVREGGRIGPATDRFTLGAMLWRAWTGKPLDGSRFPPFGRDDVTRAIAPLLHPDPSRRPNSLRQVLHVLAEHAGLPVPELDAGKVEPAAGGVPPTLPGERDEVRRASSVWVRKVPGADSGGTVELSFDDVIEEAPRAAARRPRDGDPSGTAEVSLDQIVEVEAVSDTPDAEPARSVAAGVRRPGARRREPTAELSLEDAEFLGGMVSSEGGGGIVAAGASVPLPGDLKPVPRPRRDSGVGMLAPPLYDEERGASVVSPPSRPYEPSVRPPPASKKAPKTKRPSAHDAAPRRMVSSGWLVVAVAAFVAAVIVVGALALAAWRRAERERERERRIRERIEQVRQGRLHDR